jgi:hypothetical protein
MWYQNGKLHRIGGPAVIWNFGTKPEWWENGIRIRISPPKTINLSSRRNLRLNS